MQIKQVTVLGGSGFVGSHVTHRLSTAGYNVKVLTRRREASKHLILLPNVEVVECDVLDDAALANEIKGADAVINLIGILHECGKRSFNTLHVELPGRVAQICSRQGVSRLLHMSALQASETAPSAYLRSKAAGEAAAMAYGDQLHITVFKPSVIFGREDHFLNLFAKLVKWLPVIFLGKAEAKFQPIFVEDVAQAFVNSLENPSTFGQCYELGGPEVYSLRELVQYVADTLGVERHIIGLNDRLSYLQAYAMEFMPIKLLTRDNFYSMQVDNVCAGAFPAVLGFQPMALEAVVPDYLAGDYPRHAYNRLRSRAGR
jgi:NADH dehydrogenase